MPYEYKKLRGRIVEKYGTNANFADAIKLSKTSMSLKLQGKVMFSQKDIDLWCEKLDIDVDQIGDYFFA